jgi:hypothetical protein
VFLLADFSFAIATYTSFDLPPIKDCREYKRNGIIADIKAGERIPVIDSRRIWNRSNSGKIFDSSIRHIYRRKFSRCLSIFGIGSAKIARSKSEPFRSPSARSAPATSRFAKLNFAL